METNNNSTNLIGINSLVNQTVSFLKERFPSLFLINLFNYLPLLLVLPILYNIQRLNVWMYQLFLKGANLYIVIASVVLPIVILAVLIIIIQTWTTAALISEVTSSHKLGFWKSFKNSRSLIKSFWWMSSLSGILVLGNSIFLIFPGIIYSIWFVFGVYVLQILKYKGLKSLIVSREYVRGYFWQVFGRLVVLGLFIGGISWGSDKIIVYFKLDQIFLGSFLAVAISSVSGAFISTYLYIIFQNLHQIKGDIDIKLSAWDKFKYTCLGILGFVVIFIVIPVALITSSNLLK